MMNHRRARPMGCHLHDDVKNINGSSRDYLLTAWYQNTFDLRQPPPSVQRSGLSTAQIYLDENAYANDEYTQFMNEALVNGPNAFLPSYDLGAALVWNTGPWSLRGVVMRVHENDDGNGYAFYGAELGYILHTALGEGTTGCSSTAPARFFR